MYCVYITTYSGSKLPPKYIGSSSYERIEKGYVGSVYSKKYRSIWNRELKKFPQLFSLEIISFHLTREEALEQELVWQKRFNVVKSDEWINLSLARKNGYFGRNVSGENNPMFGKKRKRPNIDPENISKGLQKFFLSEEGKQERIFRRNRVLGENNPMFGKTHSNHLKEFWSINRRGKNHPMFGKTHSNETKEKIRNSKLGKPAHNKGKPGISWSPEFREKMMKARIEAKKKRENK